jgi:hypothetical protein
MTPIPRPTNGSSAFCALWQDRLCKRHEKSLKIQMSSMTKIVATLKFRQIFQKMLLRNVDKSPRDAKL